MSAIPKTAIPDGYVAFGWHSYPSLNATARLTVAHLAPAEQGERPWEALCGRRRRGRGTHPDTPQTVARELHDAERTPCRRCWTAARPKVQR